MQSCDAPDIIEHCPLIAASHSQKAKRTYKKFPISGPGILYKQNTSANVHISQIQWYSGIIHYHRVPFPKCTMNSFVHYHSAIWCTQLDPSITPIRQTSWYVTNHTMIAVSLAGMVSLISSYVLLWPSCDWNMIRPTHTYIHTSDITDIYHTLQMVAAAFLQMYVDYLHKFWSGHPIHTKSYCVHTNPTGTTNSIHHPTVAASRISTVQTILSHITSQQFCWHS